MALPRNSNAASSVTLRKASPDGNISLTDRIRLKSAAAKSGGHWLAVAPSRRAFCIRNDAMRLALRLRLGVQPADDISYTICPLCKTRNPTHCHFHACTKLRGGPVTYRHNDIVDEVGTILRMAGNHMWKEPRLDRVDENASQDRPDGVAFGRHLERTMFDVSIVNPTSTSYLNRPGDRIEYREKEKRDKYDALARKEGCVFVPFVFESYGRIGSAARDFLRRIADSYSSTPATADAFFIYSLRSLSFALQIGNGQVAASGCERVRAAPASAWQAPPAAHARARRA